MQIKLCLSSPLNLLVAYYDSQNKIQKFCMSTKCSLPFHFFEHHYTFGVFCSFLLKFSSPIFIRLTLVLSVYQANAIFLEVFWLSKSISFVYITCWVTRYFLLCIPVCLSIYLSIIYLLIYLIFSNCHSQNTIFSVYNIIHGSSNLIFIFHWCICPVYIAH